MASATRSSYQPPIPIFKGQNYHFWSLKMQTLLKSQELWDIVEGGFEEREDMEADTCLRENRKKDAKALFFIQQAVDYENFCRIAAATTSREAWEILKKEYLDDKEVNREFSFRGSSENSTGRGQIRGGFHGRGCRGGRRGQFGDHQHRSTIQCQYCKKLGHKEADCWTKQKNEQKQALENCTEAATLDANFLKVQLRAAKCHLVLGEVEHALEYFSKCLESGAGICLDQKLTNEAAEGVKMANKVAESISLSAKLLGERTVEAASRALETISDAMSISKFSEKLLETKAEALHLFRKHEEVIQLCEQSIVIAEMYHGDSDGSKREMSLFRLWRWYMMARSHFCLGRFEKALDLLGEVEQAGCIDNGGQINIVESSISLSKLLQCRSLGNEAFRLKKYAEAMEHYSTPLANNLESRPFAAVCLCNRAAAHQALGQLADAISDCSLAIALDKNYAKALSRRATLHKAIRDYGQAARDIQQLITLLQNQSKDGDDELRKARERKSSMEEEAKKGITLDFYLILGVKEFDEASDIHKAYKKAALRHHPDKAGQFLVRTDIGLKGQLWNEISKGVLDDANRLFKIIGQAYAVLSDPSKRLRYDLEEEIRKTPN